MAANDAASRIRAVILTTQRTGSTFLVDCLGSHPDIECASEILIGEPDSLRPQYRGRFKQLAKVARIFTSGAWRPARRMEAYYAGGSARVRAFKVMYNQLAHPTALRYLRENRDIRVLHLSRQNLLKVHVSRILMGKRARVQATGPVEAVQTRVDPQEAIAAMRAARERYRHFESVFRDHPRLALTYESLFDGQRLRADTAARICEFLGVSLQPMQSRLVKLNPETLRETVTNYEELAAAIARTEFAELLD
jgi:LPS sulfotransferase NodH